MIPQKPLFADPESKSIYHKGRTNCDFCKKKLDDQFIIGIFHSKKSTKAFDYCHKCVDKTKLEGIVVEWLLVVVVDKPPKSSRPFIIKRPQLSEHKGDVFEAAHLPSDATIDNTKHAGRNNWEGAKIGMDIPAPDVKPIEFDDLTQRLVFVCNDFTTSHYVKPLIEIKETEETENGKTI